MDMNDAVPDHTETALGHPVLAGEVRDGEPDMPPPSVDSSDVPMLMILEGSIWDWWERTTWEREAYLDGLPCTLTRRERDFVLQEFEIERPFATMPFDEVLQRREWDKVFGIRYAEHRARVRAREASRGSEAADPDERSSGEDV